MGDLLRKAIVEARVLRDVAIDNAKHMLLESLDENAEGILSAKLQQEMEGDDEEEIEIEENDDFDTDDELEIEETDDPGLGEPNLDSDEEDVTDDLEEETTEDPGKSDAQLSSTDKDVTPALTEEDDFEEEEDLEFENILRELDDEMEDDQEIEMEGQPSNDSIPGPLDSAQEIEEEEFEIPDEELEIEETDDNDADDIGKDYDDEEINIEELLGDEDEEEITEEEYPGESESEDTGKEQQNVVRTLENVRAQNMRLKKKIVSRNKAIKVLTGQIHEINLFNHKLAHTTKLFKKFNLSSNSKMKIIETFDRTKSIREVKLVYATLYESYRNGGSTRRVRKIKSVKELNESTASKSTGFLAGKLDQPTVLTEGSELVTRFNKLVNYNK